MLEAFSSFYHFPAVGASPSCLSATEINKTSLGLQQNDSLLQPQKKRFFQKEWFAAKDFRCPVPVVIHQIF